MSYVTTIGSDNDDTQPKFDIYNKGPKGTGFQEHCKQLEKLNKILNSRPHKTDVNCMLKNHDKCPEYGKKAKKCYCKRCLVIGKH